MIPFDLHVLSTPPAFVLSQNQTLQKILVLAFYCQLNVSTLSFLKVLRIFTRSAQFSFCFLGLGNSVSRLPTPVFLKIHFCLHSACYPVE